MTPSRLIVTTLALAVLTACGGGDGYTVRNGPQAVHPSPSALAQGVVTSPAVVQTGTCGYQGHHCQTHAYHHHANDGSQPIID